MAEMASRAAEHPEEDRAEGGGLLERVVFTSGVASEAQLVARVRLAFA